MKIIVRPANCQGVSERDPAEEARLALTKRGKYGLPDLVFFSEIAWLDLDRLCDDVGGWHALQLGTRGSPEAGVGLAARVPLIPLDMVVGSRPTREGRGVRLRPIVGAEAWGLPFWAVHPPPPSSPRARRAYVAAARSRPGTLGGDWNHPVAHMRRTSERAYRGDGVLGVLAPQRFRPGKAEPLHIRSDHRAVDVPLHLPERRRDAA